MTHLVNRLQMEMSCYDEGLAFNIRQHFAIVHQRQIAEVIDRVCSEYTDEDEMIRIDRLEIDLGSLSPQDFDRDFELLFRKQFEQQFTEQLSRLTRTQRLESTQKSEQDIVQFFLLNGYLPWWAGHETTDLDTIVLHMLLEQKDVFQRFLSRHTTLALLWQRIACQFSPKAIELVISLFNPLTDQRRQWQGWLAAIQSELIKRNPAHAALPVLEDFAAVLDEWIIILAPKWLGAGEKKPFFFESLLSFTGVKLTGPDEEKKQVQAQLKQIATDLSLPVLITVADASADKDNTPTISITGDTKNTSSIDVPPDYPEQVPGQAPAADKDDRLRVNNAGLILLTPFFKQLFTGLDMLDKNEWIDKTAQVRAVQLLYYLATGNTVCKEYEAVLEKILCGLPVYEPIPAKLDISEKEEEEINGLLTSVIGHWKILKNTSIAGLRESFLVRNGILYRSETGWLLRVERTTIDVLLDSLPWGFTTARMPWAKYLITTEW